MNTEESQSQRIETHDTASSESQSPTVAEEEEEIEFITVSSDTPLSQMQGTHAEAQDSPPSISETAAPCLQNPDSTTSNVPNLPVHPMCTRSRNGIVKPNAKYALTTIISENIPRTKEIEATKLDWRTRQRSNQFLRLENVTFCRKQYDAVTRLKYRWKGLASKYMVGRHLGFKSCTVGLPWIRVSPSMVVSLKDYHPGGYMAPEYALYGYLTYKADVYSFGVVALEIVSGLNNAKFRRDENFVCLLDWMVDPRLGSAFNKKEVVRMVNIALLCTNQSLALRPIMSTVVSMLERKIDVEELVMVPSRLSDQSGYATALCNKFTQASFIGSSSENKSLAKSSEGPLTSSSSSSAQDLYPIYIK
ncbi:hypothetical protein DKX38_028815 [Salix brachista]|uniref:Serine-threonine/tyrosine-protein kinase catalytic domain-containing protein n=1 Tax=Salix brachista TaxID=2182728 RepID=A0A5N5J9V8_9ROSI|nr:hypothetical protein DKX38_028815 [Salix brachista]